MGIGLRLGERVLAAAEADLDMEACRAAREGGERVRRGLRAEAQPRQRLVEQEALARAERVPARASVEAVRRRLERRQRPNTPRRSPTRSVRSQVNVPRPASGVRPKWP